MKLSIKNWITAVTISIFLTAFCLMFGLHLLSDDLPASSEIRNSILTRYPLKKNSIWVPLYKISPRLQQAVICWEDPIFYHHNGFNYSEIIRSAISNIRAKAYVRGGSTITQQVAKNLYLSPKKSLIRKIKEAILTRRIESALTKDEILEIYLNIAHWGPNLSGAETASLKYFKKHANQLDWNEAALLSGILQNPISFNPNTFPERAKKQQLKVLSKLIQFKIISENQIIQNDDNKNSTTPTKI